MSDIVVVGSFMQDLAFQTAQFPSPGETRIGRFQTGPGGKGFNQAVAANRLGIKTLFIGAVGNDSFGAGVAEFARREELRTALEIVAEAPSGAASVVIDRQAQNMIVVALGANERLSVDHVTKRRAEFASAKIVVCQLECSLLATEAALKQARNNNIIAILNPAPINPDVSRAQLELADILVPNETEFAFLADHFLGESQLDVGALAEDKLHRLCRRLGNKTLVVTLGERGAFVSHADDIPSWAQSDAKNYYLVPAIKVRAVDTTGAGDAFCGGLAAGMLRFPRDFNQAVKFANVVAGISTERDGTAPAMPLLEDVLERMKRG